MNTIILAAGRIDYSNLPVNTNQSNSMIPVNGKPVIGWIIDDLIEKDITSVIIVAKKSDKKLLDFLKYTYIKKIKISVVKVSKAGTILHSVQAGLSKADLTFGTRIILGDTLIRDSYFSDENFLYIGEVTTPRLWCLVEMNTSAEITTYINKPVSLNLAAPYQAVAGYFHFKDTVHLQDVIARVISEKRAELSDLLLEYGKTQPILGKSTDRWLDFGNIENLIKAKHTLLNARNFNTLKINAVLGTITKVSQRNEKLNDEINWYKTLPEKLKVLTPRIIDIQDIKGKVEITQEYYGYPTLAELYVYGDLKADVWESILHRLFQIQKHFLDYKGNSLTKDDVEMMYLTKTFQRLEELAESNTYWQTMLKRKEIIYNNQLLKSFETLKDSIVLKGRALVENYQGTVIHGDLCFSNILFDPNNYIVRLIDPRGSFGQKGIYGDPRYDIAKLRHSTNGLYDYIVSDMFHIEEKNGSFTGEVYITPSVVSTCKIFDELLSVYGFNKDEVIFIEALLFMSMLPLHSDHVERQKIMFVTGLQLLNASMKDI
jgi:dTDP-glucose pyrophosphorylase